MSVAVVVASGGFRFRGLRFCKAVQVGRRMLSYCEASSWQVFSTRVGSHMDALLTNSSQIFLFGKCARTNLSRHYSFCSYGATEMPRTRTGPGFGTCVRRPPLRDLYLRKLKLCARTIFAPACLTALALKLVPSHKQESQTLCSYVAGRAVPSHIQTSIKISGVKI